MLSWLILFAAIAVEVCGTLAMKLSGGLTKLRPALFIIPCYTVSLGLLTLALRRIEISTAYAIWSGLGTMVVVAIGILYFRESASPAKLLSMAVIILGVLGLHLTK
jgi:small multidrug resistance pump